MNTLIELHDKAVADAVAAAIANKGDRDLPSRAALVAGIESLQAEVELLTQGWKACTAVLLKAQGERDTLRAELAALDDVKGAEPVAWLIDGDYTTAFPDIADAHKRKGCVVTPLYAGAAPQAPAPTNMTYPLRTLKDATSAWWHCRSAWGVGGMGLSEADAIKNWADRNPKEVERLGLTGAAPQAPAPLTDDFVQKVVRSKNPNLDVRSEAWEDECDECRYWLKAAHGITGEAQG